jgi:hypothetical protein
MPKPARPANEAADFAGLVTNADPRDIPPGAAQEQVNICCISPGELQVRLGYREVVFDQEDE